MPRAPTGLLVTPRADQTFPQWLTETLEAMMKLTPKQRRAEYLRDAYIAYDTNPTELTPETTTVRVGYRGADGARREIVWRHRPLET